MRILPSIRKAVARGFSLIEMLVAVGLLSVVILTLYAMFDQTQRALRGSVGQVDVFEGSRSALELLTRDLEHARPAGVFDGPHFITRLSVPAALIQNQRTLFQERQPVLQEFFAIRNITDQQWSTFGYFIASEEDPVARTSPPIGTLYRYEDRGQLVRIPGETTTLTNTPVRFLVRGLSAAPSLVEHVLGRPFAGSTATLMPYRTNAARVLDGVVNFRITPYDALGRPYSLAYPTNQLPVRPSNVPASSPSVAPLQPVLLIDDPVALVTETTFSGTAMPASVEIEVDALEPRLLEQYRALPENPAIRNKFLTNNLARIQSFRQRVPLRPYLR